MALLRKEPIFFDAIVERIMYAIRRKLGDKDSIKISHETFEDHGLIWWKSFVTINNGLIESSRKYHRCPEDSLRELAEILDRAL